MNRLRKFLTDEAGAITVEFVLVIPVILTIFMASVEASMYMARHAMLERAVDIVVRDIRLGNYDNMSHIDLKTRICERGIMAESVAVCVRAMKIWMQPISAANFDWVVPPRFCADKSQDISAVVEPTGTEFAYGADNDVMLMRICLKEDPLYPTSIIGSGMIRGEPDGSYAMITMTVFVNEPG